MNEQERWKLFDWLYKKSQNAALIVGIMGSVAWFEPNLSFWEVLAKTRAAIGKPLEGGAQ